MHPEGTGFEDMSYTVLKRKSGFSQTRFEFFLWSGEEKRKDLDSFTEDEHKVLKTEQVLCEALLADMLAQEQKLLEMLENKNDDDSAHLVDIKRGIKKLNELFSEVADGEEEEIDNTKPYVHMSVSWKEILDQKIKNAQVKVEMFNVHERIETIKQRYEKPDGVKMEQLESIWAECINVIKKLESIPLRGFQVFVVQNVIDFIKNKKFQFKPITLPI
ncbi:hypothetical protein GCK72_023957 [Caenorhabditis remanei]|uniref:Uncharacterized protein n=1 Tax=Caenorhabditis remanei TaxID=31234 RepID=A0A6A5FY48_CAERE|nr:hypothetical protein GCK72_023957 [Caenorhabditis remanei]KAF1747493.1 hypothetical protein GCK72_023957 [Caenorhabditis remanei]